MNPTSGIMIKVPKNLPAVPDEGDIEKLINACTTKTPCGIRDRAFLELLYSTVMRREEMIRLELQDIDLKEATVRVMGKGLKERILPIGQGAMHWLGEYINNARCKLCSSGDEKGLWVTRGVRRVLYNWIPFILRKYAKLSGITTKITCHDFRRAFATHMLRNGAGVVDVQQLLGHSDLSHLRHYLRLTIVDLKKMHTESRLGK